MGFLDKLFGKFKKKSEQQDVEEQEASAEELAQELMDKLHHGVTEMRVEGKYSHTEKSMIICIIRKKQVGEMMKIIKKYPGTFANYSKVNEVFGKFGK